MDLNTSTLQCKEKEEVSLCIEGVDLNMVHEALLTLIGSLPLHRGSGFKLETANPTSDLMNVSLCIEGVDLNFIATLTMYFTCVSLCIEGVDLNFSGLLSEKLSLVSPSA